MAADRVAEMEAFVRVSEAGSFSGAARTLGVSQPVVSKLIAGLESRIGARLLVRTTRSLSLTEQGATYLTQARKILADLRDAEATAKVGYGAIVGTLRINASALLAGQFVLPVVMAFRETHPTLQVQVIADDKRIDPVEESADLIVRVGGSAASSLMQRRAGVAPLGLFASPDYIKRHGRPKKAADLQEHALIPIGDRSQMQFLRAFASEGQDKALSGLTVSNAILARDAALLGGGVAILPLFLASEDVKAKRLVVILPDFRLPPLEITLLHPFGAAPPLRVKSFIDFALEEWRRRRLVTADETVVRSAGTDIANGLGKTEAN